MAAAAAAVVPVCHSSGASVARRIREVAGVGGTFPGLSFLIDVYCVCCRLLFLSQASKIKRGIAVRSRQQMLEYSLLHEACFCGLLALQHSQLQYISCLPAVFCVSC